MAIDKCIIYIYDYGTRVMRECLDSYTLLVIQQVPLPLQNKNSRVAIRNEV